MKNLSEKIEKIILQHGNRGMDRLQKSLEPGYCRRAARLIRDNEGVVIIGTGFPVSGSFESDGPISAISLYRKQGFREIGRRPNYYTDTREDALVLLKNLKEDL